MSLCSRLQGVHTAMLSGMYGGEAAFRSLTQEPQASKAGPRDLSTYESAMKVGHPRLSTFIEHI